MLQRVRAGESASPMRLGPSTVRDALIDRLIRGFGREVESATPREVFNALALAVREGLTDRWLATQKRTAESEAKRIYYLSLEFLMGRNLANALLSLDLLEEAREAVTELGVDFEEVIAQEQDAGLGNGGLGRLAACFLDSMATLQIPGAGYGIRYDYGIFNQVIDDTGSQIEQASTWLRYRNFWEIPRDEVRYTVRFGGHCVARKDENGHVRHEWRDTTDIFAVAYDTLVPGNRTSHVNHLRLWSGRAVAPFKMEQFNSGDYFGAVADQIEAKNMSRVLYPDDSTPQGKELRFKQQYFFVSASIQDIVGRHLAQGYSLEELPEHVAIQLNDTHPALAIAELLRLLHDDYEIAWDRAWEVTRAVFSYTNHTLLPEALETWPVPMFEKVLPRHLHVIYLINRRFLEKVSEHFPDDLERREQLSLVSEDNGKEVRMAHMAIVGSHTVNGVAKLHSDLLKTTVFSDFDTMYPDRLTNVTNGISVRRWLKEANPGLSALLTEYLGTEWENRLEVLGGLKDKANDPAFIQRFWEIKRENKQRLVRVIEDRTGVDVTVDSMFDVQVKRIHEYKRQLLNLLYVIVRYNRIRKDPQAVVVPRTVIFAGKAAPGYFLAKAIIKLINNVASTINTDQAIGDRLKLVFLPNYDVSLAQQIIPAADLSEQISTAGMEASGTGNMKLALNGAMTIGTLDGANIEIRDEVGPENIFIFGLTAEQVTQRRAEGYYPMAIANRNEELHEALELLNEGFFTPDNLDEAQSVVDVLLNDGEHYLVLADFDSYAAAQDRVDELYRDRDAWVRKAIINCLSMGVFSSDRSIREYASKIWQVEPLS